jgi:hypothetical protein
MSFVMIDKVQPRVWAKAALGEEKIRAKERVRIRNASAAADNRKIAIGAPASEMASDCVIEVELEREAKIVQRKGAANCRNGVYI